MNTFIIRAIKDLSYANTKKGLIISMGIMQCLEKTIKELCQYGLIQNIDYKVEYCVNYKPIN